MSAEKENLVELAFQSLLRGSFRHQCCDISDIELKLISVMQVEHGAAQIGKQ